MGFESGTIDTTEADDLLAGIREVVGEDTVKIHRNKYLESFEVLGRDRVRMVIGDVRIAVREGWARDPAAMLYADIKRLMKENGVDWENESNRNVKEASPYSLNLPQFFRELTITPLESPTLREDGQMIRPYVEGKLPWISMMGPEYFTLSTNKEKSDRVTTTIRTQEGTHQVALIRGKSRPDANEKKILTVIHGRVMAALKKMWAKQGCKHTTGDKQLCYVRIFIRQLGEELGWKFFSGPSRKRLKNYLDDLKDVSYYLDFSGIPGLEEFNKPYQTFEFLAGVRYMGAKRNKTEAEFVDIIFSESISEQLLARHAVLRPPMIITIKNEIAFQTIQYIDPILRSRLNDPSLAKIPFTIGLSNLIRCLCLPKAKWHNFKSKRLAQFQIAIDEFNGEESSNGLRYRMELIPKTDNTDYLLVAQFTSSALAGAEAR